jgi:hypothetical protein
MSNIKEQASKFIQFLSGSTFPMDSPVFAKAMEFIYIVREHPAEFTTREIEALRTSIQKCFQLSDDDLEIALAGSASDPPSSGSSLPSSYSEHTENELWSLIPKTGYLRNYCEYTRMHEGPLAYHVFCALAGVSAVANNRVYYDMTYYKVYPALSIILLGPSGIKKSTSCYVIVDMLQEWEYCETYSEKITPEAFAEAMAVNPVGLIFASELSAMLGKQKYLEGFVPLLTRLLDHRTFPMETKSGGKLTIINPAPTFVGCSTPDWYIKNTPEDTFGGGFVARQLTVYQEDSPRIQSSPGRDTEGNRVIDPLSDVRRKSIQQTLGGILSVSGEMSFTHEAFKLYDSWYHRHKEYSKRSELGLMTTYYQRKHDHAKRVAMCLHLAEHTDMQICASCWTLAVELLDWTEKFLPLVYKDMFKSGSGQDADLVIKIIRSHNGVIDHSKLVRSVQYKMDASRLKQVLNSLKEGRLIEEKISKLQHCYMLLGDHNDISRN